MRYLLLTFLLLSTHTSAEVYKSINPDGSTSYSDVPAPHGEAISLPELTPVPAVKYPKKAPAEKKENNTVLPYTLFKISSPKNQTVIRDNNGNTKLALKIKPELQTKHKHSITLLLDSKVYKKGLTTAGGQFSNLDRGSHTLSARLVDENNKTLKSTHPVTVHIRRHSQLHNQKPANPQTPRPGYYVPPTPTPTPTPTP